MFASGARPRDAIGCDVQRMPPYLLGRASAPEPAHAWVGMNLIRVQKGRRDEGSKDFILERMACRVHVSGT